VFVGALAVLLVNDHVLKGAGLLPGWLTGKLSDVAGLVVAPWLLARVLRAKTASARLAAFALGALPFVAINASPAAARAFDAVWNAVFGWSGLHAMTVCDPTDLVAVAVLPLTWRLVAQAGRHSGGCSVPRGASRGSWLGWRERALVAVATLGCVATSPGPVPDMTPFWSGTVFVWNDTRGPLDLRVRWATATRACEALGGRSDRAFGREAFGAPVTVRIDAGRTLPIDRESVPTAVTLGPGFSLPPAGDCDAILLQADAMDDTVVFVQRIGSGGTRRAIPVRPGRDELVGAPEVVRLRATATGVQVEGPPDTSSATPFRVRTAPLFDRLEPSSCAPRGERLSWSALDLVPSGASFRLDALRVLVDGCLALDLSSDSSESPSGVETLTVYACVPRDAVPLVEGALVQITHGRNADGAGTHYFEVVDADTGAGFAAYAGISGARELGGGVTVRLQGLDCEGDRLTCGSFVLPVRLEVVRSGGGTPVVDTLAPGDRIALPDGRELRFVGGVAVLVGVSSCAPEGAGDIGTFGDLLLTLPALTEP
jgi:hypothetical protein